MFTVFLDHAWYDPIGVISHAFWQNPPPCCEGAQKVLRLIDTLESKAERGLWYSFLIPLSLPSREAHFSSIGIGLEAATCFELVTGRLDLALSWFQTHQHASLWPMWKEVMQVEAFNELAQLCLPFCMPLIMMRNALAQGEKQIPREKLHTAYSLALRTDKHRQESWLSTEMQTHQEMKWRMYLAVEIVWGCSMTLLRLSDTEWYWLCGDDFYTASLKHWTTDTNVHDQSQLIGWKDSVRS